MLYLLNGPPRSGKDTTGAIIAHCVNPPAGQDTAQWKFSAELKRMVHRAYNLTLAGQPVRSGFFETTKDRPLPEFMGLTPRQAYIEFHERYLIPVHGRDILGTLLVSSIDGVLGYPRHAVITDVGNEEQCWPIIKEWRAVTGQPDSVTLIHLARPDYGWTDNRVPVSLEGVRTVDLLNPGTSCEALLWNIQNALPECAGDSSTPDGSAGASSPSGSSS